MDQFEAKHARKANPKGGKKPSSLLYPSGVHRVATPRKERRTLQESAAAEAGQSWVVVEDLDAAFRQPPQLPVAGSSLPPLAYEVDRGAVSAAARVMPPPDDTLARLVAAVTDPSADSKAAREERHAARPALLQVYHVEAAEFNIRDERVREAPSEEVAGPKLRVQPRKLALGLQAAGDAFFMTLCMWNVATGEKVSEDFVCHLNSDPVVLSRLAWPSGAAPAGAAALFSAPMRVPEIALLVHVTRAMQAETVEHTVELYCKGGEAAKTKLAKCDTDYRYASPFCLAVVPLFHGDGSLLPASREPLPLFVYPKTGFDREFVVQRLAPLLAGGGQSTADTLRASKAVKVVPGSIVFDVADVSFAEAARIGGRLSWSGVLLKPAPATDRVREVAPFFADPSLNFPLYEPVNLLFVRPLSLNVSKYSGASFKGKSVVLEVFLKDTDEDDPCKPGLSVFFGRLGQPDAADAVSTAASFQEKKPQFFEEFKLRLPQQLREGLHLVFSVSQVEPKGEKRRLGFAFLPVAVGRGPVLLQDGLHTLSVSCSFPTRYLSEPDQLRPIDKRPALLVASRVVSSVLPSDPNLRTFLQGVAQPNESSFGDLLSRCSPTMLVRSAPVILDALFEAIAVQSSAAVCRAALEEVLRVVTRVCDAHAAHQERSALLDSYVGYVLTLSERGGAQSLLNLVHAITAVLQDAGQMQSACRFGWFLCDSLVKWMYLVAQREKSLANDVDRRKRFAPELYAALEVLLRTWMKQMVVLAEEYISLAKQLGLTVAYWLLDLLSVADRGFATRLAAVYIEGVVPKTGSANQKQLLESCKLDALSMLCSHEHFVGLNMHGHYLISILIRSVLDQQRSPDKALRLMAMTALRNLLIKHDLDPRYQSPKHKQRIASLYLSFVILFVKEREQFWERFNLEEKRTSLFCMLYILRTAQSSLVLQWWEQEIPASMADFFRVLCRIVLTFEYRGKAHVHAMAREFTSMKLSRLKQQFNKPVAKPEIVAAEDSSGDAAALPATTTVAVPTLAIPTSTEPGVRSWKSKAGTTSPRVAASVQETPQEHSAGEVAAPGGSLRSWKTKAGTTSPRSMASSSESANLAEGGSMRSWKQRAGGTSPRPSASAISEDAFPQNDTGGSLRSWKTKTAAGGGGGGNVSPRSASASSGHMAAATSSVADDGAAKRSWRGKANISAHAAADDAKSHHDEPGSSVLCVQEEHLAREALVIVLDLVMQYVEKFSASMQKPDNALVGSVFEVMAHALHVYHTAESFLDVCKVLRLVTGTFRSALFVQGTGFAQHLTYRLLGLFNSEHGTIRRNAAAMMAVLMRDNFAARGNCNRMLLAGTIGINRMSDPTLKLPLQHALFAESLGTFSKVAASFELGSAFDSIVGGFHSMFQSVLSNMARIKEFSYDPERLAELYNELCEGYRNSPDLRAAWLETLAFHHESQQNYEEAAQCRIHLSALVSTYLTLLKPAEAVPVDRIAFEAAAPNSASEFEPATNLAQEEGVCDSEMFSRIGLFHQLEDGVRLLKQDSLFESCVAVVRLQCAIHLRNRDWSLLAMRYDDLAELSGQVVASDAGNNRMFSKWYRVNLFGDVFKGLSASTWIYKERPDVLTMTIVERLKRQYASVVGEDKVHIMANSEVATRLEPGHAYLQVAAIQPYLDAEELSERRSEFERQTNLRRFVMETPFTMTSGKAQGNWDEQHLRRVIMTTNKAFPCVAKRLPVVAEESTILTPIQNALSVITDRCENIKKLNASQDPAIKSVQQFLQGSVLLQVNEGPLAICKVFLAPENADKYVAGHVASLSKAMSSFLFEARALLLLNGTLIDSTQIDFQEVLIEGYNDMRLKLREFLGSEPLPEPVSKPEKLAESGTVRDSTLGASGVIRGPASAFLGTPTTLGTPPGAKSLKSSLSFTKK